VVHEQIGGKCLTSRTTRHPLFAAREPPPPVVHWSGRKSGVLAFARLLRASFLFVEIGLEARFTNRSVRQSVRDAYISYDVDTSFKM